MINLSPILKSTGTIKGQYSKREMFEKHNLIELYDKIMNITAQLDHHSISMSARVNFIQNTLKFDDIKCPCGKCPKWLKENARFAKYCSDECRYKYYDSTNNFLRTKEGQIKARSARYKKHGSQQDILNKSRKTMLKKYGVDTPSSLDFVKKKKRDKQLVPGAVEQMKTRQKQTMLERYGVENSMHRPDIIEKVMIKRYKSNLYTFQSGETMSLYGYEHHALSILENEYNVTFNDLITSNRRCIKYFDATTNKYRKYLPDFIFKDKKLVEVKSEYTITRDIQKNIAKWNASVEQGFTLEIWIIGIKGDLIRCIPWAVNQSESIYRHQNFDSLPQHSLMLRENHHAYHACQTQLI